MKGNGVYWLLGLIFCIPSAILVAQNESTPRSHPNVYAIGCHYLQCTSPLNVNATETKDKLGSEQIYKYWQSFLSDIERHAINGNFDLEGIKLWITVSWDDRGAVNKISYQPHRLGRAIAKAELNEFLRIFADRYQRTFPELAGYTHYAVAVFPQPKPQHGLIAFSN